MNSTNSQPPLSAYSVNLISGFSGPGQSTVTLNLTVAGFVSQKDMRDNVARAVAGYEQLEGEIETWKGCHDRSQAKITQLTAQKVALVAALEGLLCHPVGIDTSASKVAAARRALAEAKGVQS